MWYSALTVLSICPVTLTRDVPTLLPLHVHERAEIPPHYTYTGEALATNTVLKLEMAIVSNDIAGLRRVVEDVSEPHSSRYGKYLSKEEVEAYLQPSQKAFSAVDKWLKTYGIVPQKITYAGDLIQFTVNVSIANTMLDAKFATFKHRRSGKYVSRTLSYSLPHALRRHVQYIHPTTAFDPDTPISLSPRISSAPVGKNSFKQLTRGLPPSCSSSYVTVTCIKDLYGLPTNIATMDPNHLSVIGLADNNPDKIDTKYFIQKFRPDINPNTTYTFVGLAGETSPEDPNTSSFEALADVSFTLGTTGSPVSFIHSNDETMDAFLVIAQTLLQNNTLPEVMSISYGMDELSFMGSQPIAINTCNAFMALAARGMTTLVASGDGGAAGFGKEDGCTVFHPTFPSTCPYVTSVGGTTLTENSSETGVSFSSGGFSNLFPQPSYQTISVNQFLSNMGDSNAGLFNKTGRAYPDVSAISNNMIFFFQNGRTVSGMGTSFSSPVVAAVVAFLNAHRKANGKPLLGFLNPAIYQNPGAFNDITGGNNIGCNSTGFMAMNGWDAVTGLGTPNFASLVNALG
ncbi:family S53 protease-like protein [Hysterangium stoloniferum]|nr:family S53 protease-like protein [Hysterangium stoloniferum]